VQHVDVALAGDLRLACVKSGLYLFEAAERPLARWSPSLAPLQADLVLEVMAGGAAATPRRSAPPDA
jgi:hypothetical protein